MTGNTHRTSINLDDETSEIAKRLGNRSEFVRECLRRWNAWDTKAHVHPTISDKCFPLSRKGCCVLCWPDGPPDLPEWMYYLESGGKVNTGNIGGKPIFAYDVPYNNKWIEEKARENNKVPHFPIPTEEQFKKSRLEGSSRWVLGNLWQKLRLKFK